MREDYYKCQLFEFIGNGLLQQKSFSFVQQEIKLLEPKDNGQISFKRIENTFTISKLLNLNKVRKEKPLAILTIKNNLALLQHTFEKIESNFVFDDLCFLVVDDRSSDAQIEDYCRAKMLPYCRVENSLDEFNFSVLNNIGAFIAKEVGCEEIVLWNSDLWPEDKFSVSTVLSKHRATGSTISGTKLIYPKISVGSNTGDSDNIEFHFKEKVGSWRGTVQYGGGAPMPSGQPNSVIFLHVGRFSEPNWYLVDCDKPEVFVTGAFMVLDLEWFLANGGLNCSLANQAQDVELCYRAFLQGRTISYFGKGVQLSHDESAVQFKENTKVSPQAVSDELLSSKLLKGDAFYEKFFRRA